jgi:hypothetical protein
MTTSPTSSLSKPTSDDRISAGTLAYLRARNKARLYEEVLGEFEKSGLTQSQLARRLGKRPEVVSRFLSAPGNWEIDSISDYVFAMQGGELGYSLEHPLEESARNDVEPSWLSDMANSVTVKVTPSSGEITRLKQPIGVAAE